MNGPFHLDRQILPDNDAISGALFNTARNLMASGKCEEAGFEFGKALHVIQDSYSGSHVRRDQNSWKVVEFYNYTYQNSAVHTPFDEAVNSGSYKKAQDATKRMLENFICPQNKLPISVLVSELFEGGYSATLSTSGNSGTAQNF